MFKRFARRVAAVPALVAAASPAFAEFTITPPALDYTLLGTLCTSILAGLAAIWLVRKVVKLMNRS